MTMELKPFIVFVFGPPGSGKSTQAEMVAAEFGATHFNTGEVLREIFANAANLNDSRIAEQKKIFDAGGLNDSGWVREIVVEEVRTLHQEAKSAVFSGSPRTVFEAEAEIPPFKEWYAGRLMVAILEIREETTLFRNSHRKVCESCGHVISWSFETKNMLLCPKCGETLITRHDDTPEIIKWRLKVYHDRTLPLFQYFMAQGIPVTKIDGEPLPEIVFQSLKAEVLKILQ